MRPFSGAGIYFRSSIASAFSGCNNCHVIVIFSYMFMSSSCIFVFIRSICFSNLHILSERCKMARQFHVAPMSAESALSAASAIGTNVKKIVPKIYDIMRDCKENKAGCMQPAVDAIVALCITNDLAYRRNIRGGGCGIHPEHRAKTGVDPLNAQNLALKISLQGYSESRLENPMGFEKGRIGDTGCISPKCIS